MTRRELSELIQRRIANGDIPDDFKPHISEINYWIEHGIAYAAMKNYTDSVSLEVDYVSDAFYCKYSELYLSKDGLSGNYYALLPSTPFGLPRGFDITSVTVDGGGLSREVTRVTQNQLGYFRKMPQDLNMIYYWVIGRYIHLFSQLVLDNKTLSVVMASSGNSSQSGLDIDVNCPPDLIPVVVDYVVRQFIQPTQIDNSNDGVQKK